MNKNSFSLAALSFTLLNVSAIAAQASGPALSDFFQDWKLDTSQNNSTQCHATVSALPLDRIPGVNGIPGPGYDLSTGITFTFNDPATGPYDFPPGTAESFTLVGPPSADSNGPVNVARLAGNELATKTEAFTLLANGGLLVVNNAKNSTSTCSYANAHPSIVGKVEVGATLSIDGTQVAACSFVPATPRPDQIDFVYNEKCSFGKYVLKTYLDTDGVVIKTVLEANPKATNDMELIRSTENLNAGTENYLSRDTEITVADFPGVVTAPVDNLSSNTDEYFISPYETQSYRVHGAENHAVVRLIYSTAP